MATSAYDAEGDAAAAAPSFLDRTIDLGALRWALVAWIAVVAGGIALRFAQLDVWAMAPDEARRAFDAFSLYQGSPVGPGQHLPTTSPLFLLLQAFSFFLFGVTDATARFVPVVLGLAIVLLPLGLRPFVGRTAAFGMALLAAFSPTLVYFSRTGEPEIAVACFALLFVVAVLRLGLARENGNSASAGRWAVTAGVALGAMYASSPSSVMVLIGLVVGAVLALMFDTGRDGAIARAARAFQTPANALAFAAGLVATLLVLFTRLFSDLGAISGLGTTFADWVRLLASGSTTTPTQFFLLAIFLYEPLAIAFALVAVFRVRPSRPGDLPWTFFGGWFGALLVLFSFASRRAPEDAVLVTLPLILLGGIALGDMLEALNWRDIFHGRGGLLLLTLFGLLIGISAFLILAGRISTATSRGAMIFQVAVVGILVVAPLGVALVNLIHGDRTGGKALQPAWVALLALGILLGAYTLRSSVLLNFYRADEGTELLAWNAPTGAIRPLVEGLRNLSRDQTVLQGSIRDVTGGHGLKIAADERVASPFRWYFRDFPDFSVVAAGQAPLAGADVVFAPDDTGMAEKGYTPKQYPYLNREPGSYAAPHMGTILKDIVLPSQWKNDIRYLLYRDIATPPVPQTVSVGLNQQLTTKVYPNSGPFGLFSQAGAGSGRGQFTEPRGIAVAQDTGTIYVVDMGNDRVERFGADGNFIGIWGGADATGGVTFEQTQNGLGPTGITVGPDGLIYVCDTWQHRIVVLDENGKEVREFGAFADVAGNPAAATTDTGRFFGPRAVAVTDDEIYVVDTGNERVQVFAKDGTFKRAWGGKGSGPGQFNEPVGIALGPDGRVYIADSNNGRISVFDRNGTPLQQWPVPAWQGHQFFEPYLAFGRDGNLYATSSATGSVEVYTPNGVFVRSITTIDGTQLQRPIGITADRDGSLLITDAGRAAVYRYVPPAAPVVPPAAPAASPAASPLASPAVGSGASLGASLVASPAASPSASPIASPGAGPAVNPAG